MRDADEPVTAMDDEILAWLRKLSRPTLLLINKIDGTDEDTVRSEFARYGFSEIRCGEHSTIAGHAEPVKRVDGHSCEWRHI